MIKPPDRTQWDTSQISPERRTYLDANFSFEQISARAVASLEIVGADIVDYWSAPPHESDGRQVIFLIRIDPEVSDLLCNAPDGLRGRYWQSPDCGFLATKYLLNDLAPALLTFAKHYPPKLTDICKKKKITPMEEADIKASLTGLSAKIWPREYDEGRTNSFLVEDHLFVQRWAGSEESDPRNPRKWRKSPKCGEWEVKGALLGADTTEYIPEIKRDRSAQLFRFGFT